MSTTDQHAHGRPLAEDLSTMPENHLDLVYTPGSIDPRRAASVRTRLIAVISMPLFFLIAFTLTFVSATHAPTPHDMALTISGPASVTQQLANAIDEQADGAFNITQHSDANAARDAVLERDAVGALIVDGTDVTTVTASGGGLLATQVIQSAGAQVAAQLGGTNTVEDVSPLPADDPTGTALFFFLIVCTVGAFMSITVISQVIPKAGARAMITTAIGAAILVPVLGFSVISLFVDLGVTFGASAGVIGVGMVYAFTVGMLATLFTLLLGQGAVFAEILILVALSFPSSGGSVPESMLPPFWQVIHNSWLGAGGFEAMRSILFFDSNGLEHWFIQLLIWTAAAIVLTTLVSLRNKRRATADTSADDSIATVNEPDGTSSATRTPPKPEDSPILASPATSSSHPEPSPDSTPSNSRVS